ncbi:MAG: hypothetical protein LAQ69_45400 [Acidobacteriia bacterium]|nr:hypothetical protein [Terriglobia bacterium]
METRRPPFALKLLPSFTDFAFLMPVVWLFGRMNGLKSLLADCDTGWHIRTGDWIVANHVVPAHDIFSFSKPGAPWFSWEWLSDVLFAWLNGLGGLRAVVLFSILLIAVTFTALFRLVRRRSNPIVAFAVTTVAAAGSSIHWLARPHLFTLLFLVLFCAALERVREGHTRLAGVPYLAILPVATVLWTNLHGGFFVGILVIGAYGAGELLSLAFCGDNPAGNRLLAGRRARQYFLCGLACLAASLINPYFYRLHMHLVQDLLPYTWQNIQEWLSPSFHHPAAIYFEAMLVLSVVAAGWKLSKGSFTESVLILLWAHGALLAVRNIPIFMIVAAVPVAAVIQEWLERLPEWNVAGWLRAAVGRFNHVAAETGETDRVGRWHLVSAMGLLLLAAVIWAPHPPQKFRAEFDPQRYPAGALATLRGDLSAHIFTHDEWGDYLIWSLYPSQKVFVDGRAEFYGDDFEKAYTGILNVRDGWENTLGRFGVDTILMPPNTPLSGVLKESGRWRVVYDDRVALVFRSASRTVGQPPSIALTGEGVSRDREVTKTQASDRAITETKTKT